MSYTSPILEALKACGDCDKQGYSVAKVQSRTLNLAVCPHGYFFTATNDQLLQYEWSQEVQKYLDQVDLQEDE